MTLEALPETEGRFLRRRLPWVVAAAALVIYLATLNLGVTLSNLPLAARINGWDWRPMLSQPLLFLLTYPCRWLPPATVPLALNLLGAALASLVLATLARSVALLPHDRLEQQRLLARNGQALLSLPNAWVPIILAAVALGLQLSFWENATAACGEMLDLLLFAYFIRCLLEYRLHEHQPWLDRAMLAWGAGAANSWIMLACLPLVLVAILWTKRLHLFRARFLRRLERSGWESARAALTADLRFLLRMALFGLAGLSLFLVVPLAQAFSPGVSVGFWAALRAAAVSYKTALFFVASVFLREQREMTLLLAAVSLLPVLVLSIRWRAFTAGKSYLRFDLASFILHLAHAVMLLACVWVAFDPPFSPRQISRRLGVSLPVLPLYYLGALSIGYYSGFFLLVFSGHTRRHRRLRRALGWAAPIFIYVLLGLTLAGLLLKNTPAIRAANGPHLDRYARWVAGSLPPEGAVVLSEDALRLAVLQSALARGTNAGRYLFVDSSALPFPAYRAYLIRKYPVQWRELVAGATPTMTDNSTSRADANLDHLDYLQLLTRLARTNRVFDLQPSFGILLERFYLQPHGLIYELKRYPANSISGPPLDSAVLAENEAFWQRAVETDLKPLLQLVAQPDEPLPGLENRLMELGHLQTPPPAPAVALAHWCSAALNCWGVMLQRNNRSAEATPCFALAQKLNPDNLPARVNLQCNSNLLAGWKVTTDRSQSFQDEFGKYRNWNQILLENGPFDEPRYCYLLGRAYEELRLSRQAAQQLERVTALAPGDTSARLGLGDLLNRCGLPDQALRVVAGIQADSNLQPLGPNAEVDLALVQANAWFAKTNRAKAEGIIQTLLASRPDDATLLSRAAALFAAYQSYSNALRLADRRLELTPDDPFALFHKGTLCITARDYSNAIPPLTRVLALSNTYPARLNRACAYFYTGRLAEAEADYQALLQAFPTNYQAWKGLAQVAFQRKDTNTAVSYYQRYLSQIPPGSEEARTIAAHLKALR